MRKKSMTIKQLLIGASLIAAVGLMSQYGDMPGTSTTVIKQQWNLNYSQPQAYHVEKLSGLPLFAVYTQSGVFYTDSSMEEFIQGRRLAPHDGKLIQLNNAQIDPDKIHGKTKLVVDKTSNPEVEGSFKSSLTDPLIKNQELVSQLKAEIAKTIKKAPEGVNSSKSPPSKQTNESPERATTQKVNPDDIREDKQFVYYGGSKINKIQYDQNGQTVDDEKRRQRIRSIFDNAVSQADGWTIPYLAENEKLKILVFTDPTCPYCQKLHRDIDRLNKAGISVYYMLYPRALVKGTEDKSAQAVISMMNTFWCSETPKKTMDKIYNHEYVEPNDACFAKEQGRTDFPVQEHFLLGRIFNLAATPLTVLSDGRMLYGYGGYTKFMDRVGKY